MNYVVMVATLAILVFMLVYTQRLLHFLNLLSIKFKTAEPEIVEPSFVQREVLIKLAKIEKFLYKERFTRRLIVEHPDSYTFGYDQRYVFYYYQLIDGIHAYVEAVYSNPKNIEFRICFETLYDSKNVVLTTNKSKYILNVVPKKVYLFEYKKFSVDKLFEAHMSDRKIENEAIYKKRLNPNELLNYEIKKEQDYIWTLVKNGYAKYTNYGFKLSPTLKLWNNGSNINKILKVTKSGKSIILKLIISYILILGALAILFFYLTSLKHTAKPIIIKNPKQELANFKKHISTLQGLTKQLPNSKHYTLKESMETIDNYLHNSKIIRFIGEPLKGDVNSSNLPCKVPLALQKIYRWHNGIELLLPNRDFFRFNDFKKSYFVAKKRKKDLNSSMVFVFASKYEYRGLAYSCKKQGLFEYSTYANSKSRKDFYNFNHFLKVTAEAYKEGAFYDDVDEVNVNFKKFLKIYKSYFSKKDKQRYKLLIKYLKNKSSAYLHSSKELKLALLNEISKTYEPNLAKSVKTYLKDNDKTVVKKAIEALGNVGNKSNVPILIKYLKNNDIQIRNITLLALAKIVDKQDIGLLEYITPLINDKSILVRISAYSVLTKIENTQSLIKARELFPTEKPIVKLAIIKLMAKTGDKNDINILKRYLNKVKKINYSKKDFNTSKNSNPNLKILEYEILKAIKSIREKNSLVN